MNYSRLVMISSILWIKDRFQVDEPDLCVKEYLKI
jgi:hypothetical protein